MSKLQQNVSLHWAVGTANFENQSVPQANVSSSIIIVFVRMIIILFSELQAPRFITLPSASGSVVAEGRTKILQCQALGEFLFFCRFFLRTIIFGCSLQRICHQAMFLQNSCSHDPLHDDQ